MSRFLSLDWFKSKVEQSVEKIIEKRIDNLIESDEFKVKRVMLVDNHLTVILEDGEIFSKPNATKDDYNLVVCAKSREDIITIVSSEAGKKDRMESIVNQKKAKAINEGLKILKEIKCFKVKDNKLYLRGIKRTIPPLLAEKFIEVVLRVDEEHLGAELNKACNDDDEFVSLKRFFMWCCLNPRAEVAKELYRFLTENSFKITKQGFFVALRNVVSLENDNGSNDSVKFISNVYNKTKAVWKKSPKDYTIYKTEDGVIDFTKNSVVSTPGFQSQNHIVLGNLQDLYLDLPNMRENRFTDEWTKTFDIRVGKVVEMPKEQCNWSTQDCAAAGLHFTADQIHYVGCGDTSVLVLINPMKVVGIGTHKGRCYEYLPIMTVPREEATTILHDNQFDTLELEHDYAVDQLKKLKTHIKDGFSKESGKDEFNLSPISSSEINILVSSLKDMKEEIKGRIKTIN